MIPKKTTVFKAMSLTCEITPDPSSTCRLTDDSTAQFFCEYLEAYQGLGLADLDTGTERTRFVRDGNAYRPIRIHDQPDSYASAPEIYQTVLRVRPDLIDPRVADDGPVIRALTDEAARIRESLSRSSLRPASFDYQREFGRRIFSYLIRPQGQGGFGLTFDTAEGGTRTLADISRDRRATCLEFVNLYLTAADIAGLTTAVPLELFQEGNRLRNHVAVGFVNPENGRLETVANFDERIQSVGPPASNQVWSPFSRRELLAFYYNARGVRNPDHRQGESDIDFGLRLDPGNYLLLFSKAWFAGQRGDLEEARNLLLESISANPTYAQAYFNLNGVSLRIHDAALADWAWNQYALLPARP